MGEAEGGVLQLVELTTQQHPEQMVLIFLAPVILFLDREQKQEYQAVKKGQVKTCKTLQSDHHSLVLLFLDINIKLLTLQSKQGCEDKVLLKHGCDSL